MKITMGDLMWPYLAEMDGYNEQCGEDTEPIYI